MLVNEVFVKFLMTLLSIASHARVNTCPAVNIYKKFVCMKNIVYSFLFVCER